VRTAYKCRAYPDEAQQVMLSRTFGCVRVAWNRTLAARHGRWHAEGKGTGYAETDRALTAMKRMLEYKAQRHGRTVVAVDRWYPSSKTCSACGHLLAELSLSTRMWQCPSCGARHDRDVNAAKNILAAGLAAGTGNGADACGGDVRRARATRTRPPVKQEPRPAREGIPIA